MKQRRRIFLKVLAAGPLVGCAGVGPDGSSPGGDGGREGTPGGDGGREGTPEGDTGAGVGGSSSTPGGAGQTGGTFFTNSGNGPGSGGFFGNTGGRATGGASSGGPSTGAGGTSTALPGMLIGNVNDFPLGSLSIASGLFFLGRDAQGIYVMSMQCTHKGCAVELAGEALQCPCHLARFDRTGNVLGGPAPAPLPHFAVYLDAAGNISVDRFTVVSSSTRTPV